MSEISVIVPVYNVESYLPQCIDSIRKQTFSDIEIVCVVDGSTDRSEAILRLYEIVEPRLRIIVKENGGLSSARNVGIDKSTSPILMFVDSDDMLAPNACDVVYKTFCAHETEVVTFGARCYPEFSSSSWYEDVLSPRDVHYDHFDTKIVFEERSRPFAWRNAVKADFLKRHNLRFDETVRFGEDQIFQFEMYPKAHGVTFVSDKLYDYRLLRKDSLMMTRAENELLKMHEHANIVEKICKSWKREGLLDKYPGELLGFIAEVFVYDFMTTTEENRKEMLGRLEDFFAKWFTEEQIDLLVRDESEKVVQFEKDFFKRLKQGPIGDKELESIKKAYYKLTGYHEGEGGRPDWMNSLRTVVPMSAKGLEDRLKEVSLTEERLRWMVEESGACTRALTMLKIEIESKRAR